MPNHIKAYIVVMAIGFMCHLLWQRASNGLKIAGYEASYIRRIGQQYFNAWMLLTSCMFLSSNYYIFLLLSFLLIVVLRKRLPIHVQGGLYIVLLLGAPSLSKTIPGVFGLQQLVQTSWPMVLGLTFFLTSKSGRFFVMKNGLDWVIVLFFLTVGLLLLRKPSFTDGLRDMFIFFNLICMPYFIAKKISSDIVSVKFVLLGYIFIALILSSIAVFSSLKHWNVYQSLNGSLALEEMTITGYKYRGGFLRASATVGSIQLAIICFCAVMIYSYLLSDVQKSIFKKMGLLLLFLSIVLTFSRGPWLIGLGVLMLYFTMARGSKGIFYFVSGLIGFGLLLYMSGMFDPVMQGLLLRDSGNVDYRQQLLKLGIAEVMKNPLLGNLNFRNSADLQVLRQGEGIVDIVNTYLQIALGYGVLALVFFVYAILIWPVNVYRRAKKYGDPEILGTARVYLMVLFGIAGMIFTVSSFNVGGVFFPLMMFLVGVGHGIRRV